MSWDDVGRLLWHGCRTLEPAGRGRAGIKTEHRASPSAGGLHPVSVVCHLRGDDTPPRLYLPRTHQFAVLDGAELGCGADNDHDVQQLLGTVNGCTLRFVGDLDKVRAAYENPESLLWRDAGALLATLCLTAEWLGLTAAPLGLVGTQHVRSLGFPTGRFAALGALQIGMKD